MILTLRVIGVRSWARAPWVRNRTLPSFWNLKRPSLRPLAKDCFFVQKLTVCLPIGIQCVESMVAQKRAPFWSLSWIEVSWVSGSKPAGFARAKRPMIRILSPFSERGRSWMNFESKARGAAQQSGSSASTRPSPSLSMQSPQISLGGLQDGAVAQSGSAQSASPSQSLSMPSLQISALHAGQLSAWAVVQVPAEQTGVLQLSPAGQSVTVVHGMQPGMWEWMQPLLCVLQASVVQALPSSQLSGGFRPHCPSRQVSAPLQALPSLHGVPLATFVCTQPVTGSRVSVVQGFWSSHSIGGFWQPEVGSQLSAVLASWSSQLRGVWTQPLAGSQLSVVQAL